MDRDTLDSLITALEASPDNHVLAFMVLAGFLELDRAQEGFQFWRDQQPDLTPATPEQSLCLGQLCLAGGEPQRTLDLPFPEDPANQLLRARAQLALGERDRARDLYQQAVEANPSLEDRILEGELRAHTAGRVVNVDGKAGRLRVIANDDTDHTELNRLLHPEPDPVTFEQVGGLESIKKQITKRIILPFQKPSLFAKFKKRVGGGLILYGPPGCGKTLLARATAGECGARFFNVAISDILDMYIGESERKLHAIFDKARSSAPAVLFFDELEAIGGKRQFTRESTSSKLVSQFLSEMDGFNKNDTGMLVLGATNVPWAIDPAFRRPGRFDRVLFVPPPDREARAAILQLALSDLPVSDDVNVSVLARMSSGFSGADLAHVVDTASDLAIEAAMENQKEELIDQKRLLAAIKEVKPTTLEWLTTARNYARYANEAGQYDEVLDFLKRHGK